MSAPFDDTLSLLFCTCDSAKGTVRGRKHTCESAEAARVASAAATATTTTATEANSAAAAAAASCTARSMALVRSLPRALPTGTAVVAIFSHFTGTANLESPTWVEGLQTLLARLHKVDPSSRNILLASS